MTIDLQNVRVHKAKRVELGDVTVLSGTNGTGKTSVLHAITMALWARDFYGGRSLDRFINHDAMEMVAQVHLNGRAVKRVVRPDSVTAYMDDKQVAQPEIDMLYGRLDLQLAMMNPLYLMGLPPKDIRALALQVTKDVDEEKIFIEKYGTRLLDRYKVTSRAQAREQLRQAKDELLKAENQLTTRREELQVYKTELRLRQADLITKLPDGVSIGDLARTISQLDEKLRTFKEQRQATAEARARKKQLLVLKSKVLKGKPYDSLEDAIQALKVQESKGDEFLDTMSRTRGQLEGQLEMLQNGVKNGKCTVCGSKVDTVGESSLTVKLRKKLEKINERASQAQAKRAKIIEARERLEDLAEEIKDVDRALRLYNAKEHEATQEKYDKIRERLGELTPDRIQAHVEAEAVVEDRKRMIDDWERTIGLLVKRVESLQEQIKDLEVLAKARSKKGVESQVLKLKTKEIVSALQKYSKHFSVVTRVPNKTTDGYKEVFHVMYKGDALQNLSWGERVLTATALSLVLRKLSGSRQVPVLALDEAGLLGNKFVQQIIRWCRDDKVNLILARLSNGSFKAASATYSQAIKDFSAKAGRKSA